jgi:hypothetical protein
MGKGISSGVDVNWRCKQSVLIRLRRDSDRICVAVRLALSGVTYPVGAGRSGQFQQKLASAAQFEQIGTVKSRK